MNMVKNISSDVFKQKKQYPTFWDNFKGYFGEFSRLITLETFKYIGDTTRTIIEKFFWTTVLIICVYLSWVTIIDTYRKWIYSPVIVSFAQSPVPVGDIPFPAVTICSETKAKQRMFNFTDFYHTILESRNVTEEERNRFEDISLLCDPHIYNTGHLTTDDDVVEYFKKIAPGFKETLWVCLWQSQNETCHTLFTPTLTEEGICYTFNTLDKNDIYTDEVFQIQDLLNVGRDSRGWSLENGYGSEVEIDTFPRRAMTSGVKAGLTVLVTSFIQDQDFVCRGPVQGFKVSLHNPGEIPRVGSQFFRAPLNQEIITTVLPDMIATSPSLRHYDPHRRGCYFSEERKLRYFKEYTQQNCDIECFTNITYKLCGCVSFHMPHTEKTAICGSGSNYCVTDAQLKMVSEESDSLINCDCLPACTTLTYSTETSQADFNWRTLISSFKGDPDEFPGIQVTRLRFAFKEMQFIPSERNELYGTTDFLANIGGILGFFLGFSFVTLIEIIYFLTLRLWINIKRYGRYYWSASDDLLENDEFIHPYKYKNENKQSNLNIDIKVD